MTTKQVEQLAAEEFNMRLTATSLLARDEDGNQIIYGMRCGYEATSLPESLYPFEMTGTVALTNEEIAAYPFYEISKAVAAKLSTMFATKQ